MIKKTEFIKSITDLEFRPLPRLPEVLLIGRSNVGKSSFINALTNSRKLALVSKIPGKTMTLNYFLLNDSFYLVDAPGYGYVKKNKQFQNSILPMISNFLDKNITLKVIFQLIDFKVGFTKLDLLIYRKLVDHHLTPIFIFNKKDKVLKNKVLNRLKEIKKQLLLLGVLTTFTYLVSCKTKEGISDIISLIYDKI